MDRVARHSSQGATADRVLVHVDTEQAREELINSRLAYVSVSRGNIDAHVYDRRARNQGTTGPAFDDVPACCSWGPDEC